MNSATSSPIYSTESDYISSSDKQSEKSSSPERSSSRSIRSKQSNRLENIILSRSRTSSQRSVSHSKTHMKSETHTESFKELFSSDSYSKEDESNMKVILYLIEKGDHETLKAFLKNIHKETTCEQRALASESVSVEIPIHTELKKKRKKFALRPRKKEKLVVPTSENMKKDVSEKKSKEQILEKLKLFLEQEKEFKLAEESKSSVRREPSLLIISREKDSTSEKPEQEKNSEEMILDQVGTIIDGFTIDSKGVAFELTPEKEAETVVTIIKALQVSNWLHLPNKGEYFLHALTVTVGFLCGTITNIIKESPSISIQAWIFLALAIATVAIAGGIGFLFDHRIQQKNNIALGVEKLKHIVQSQATDKHKYDADRNLANLTTFSNIVI